MTKQEITNLRKELYNFIALLDNEVEDYYYELAILSLQKSRMWMGKVLSEMGEKGPYPESINDRNEVIDPGTDIDEDTAIRFFEPKREYSDIEFIKFARRVIDNMVKTNDFLIYNNDGLINMPYYESEKNLIEAKMLFGMALRNQLQEEEITEGLPESDEKPKPEMKVVKNQEKTDK